MIPESATSAASVPGGVDPLFKVSRRVTQTDKCGSDPPT